ncbi:MAG: energy transducer TonB [Bacteroidetes bacterium]|nr:energy transducer TonB [Bacteroidota bacterium]
MIPKKNPKADMSRYSGLFFQIGLVVMLGVTYIGMEWKSTESSDLSLDTITMDKSFEEEIPVVNLNVPPPPPPPPMAAAPEVLQVVDDQIDIEETVLQSTETNQNQVLEIVKFEAVEAEEEEEDVIVPFAIIEQAPIFPGCENVPKDQQRECFQTKMDEHVRNNFSYPQVALELGIQGRVYIVFDIDKEGRITNIKMRAPDKNLENEARRIVSKLPKMLPGKQRGKPVKVSFSLPINFVIHNQ